MSFLANVIGSPFVISGEWNRVADTKEKCFNVLRSSCITGNTLGHERNNISSSLVNDYWNYFEV